jgi:hypothetical protein
MDRDAEQAVGKHALTARRLRGAHSIIQPRSTSRTPLQCAPPLELAAHVGVGF